MWPLVILSGVTPDDVYAWLPECVLRAKKEMTLHPLRPRPRAMIPRHVPIHQLYIYAPEMASWYLGIYETLPEETAPFGTPLMLIGGGLYNCVANQEELWIGLWRSSRFPLALPEIAWLLEQRFSSKYAPDSPPAPLMCSDHFTVSSTAWAAPPDDKSGQDTVNSQDIEPDVSESSRPMLNPGKTTMSGAPPLACNIWLEAQMGDLPDSGDYTHLFSEWLRQYIEIRGEPPADPRRSFMRAAEAILRRKGRR